MFATIFEKASNLSESFQAVQDRLPESLQSIQNAKAGASKVHDDLAAKIGTTRKIKTPQGVREVVEICLLGDSENVTKVRDLASDKEFVLKRMTTGNQQKDEKEKTVAEGASAMVSLEALQTLVDKAEMLPQLGVHPNIAQIFSSQPDNTNRSHGHVFLMEICEESVTSIIKSKGPMSGEEVLKMLKDVVAGLEFLHGQKEGPITHGSVEMSHVLKGQGGEWKLASFGKTSFDGESEGCAKVKLDVWQLGALIFVALFGAHPFGRASEGSKAAMSLKEGCALAVPHQRPRTLLEGKLCILMHWLLAPDHAVRPTAKQVGVLLGHLERMVASQIMKTLPPPIRKMVAQTMMASERLTLVEGLSSIPTEIGIRLVKEFGENLLVNPKIIPAEKLQEVMPRAVMSRIKELNTLYGIPEGSYNNVKVVVPKKCDLSEDDLKAESAEQGKVSSSEPGEPDVCQEQEAASVNLMDADLDVEEHKERNVDLMDEPKDLLDLDHGNEVQDKKESNGSQDLLDLDNSEAIAQPQQSQETASTLDLLDFREEEGVTSITDSTKHETREDLLDMPVGSTLEAQSPPPQPASLDLLDFGAPSAQSNNISTGGSSTQCASVTLPNDLLFDMPTGNSGVESSATCQTESQSVDLLLL
eukprot:gnl/MRDRNA2_/MRDRNA2_58714_c0_seq1.p1 gnl/MRDRNA2_/MRDRNA2_58714_c0~~gnl/MRDRNA2_/MRDRNA2_58714_c0_seq1.p1  ORF type:complete len:692 (+),score=152.65 gnl/MRDRNA2_/MRDRNA2_58714_c0_seq1:148-2076(+)